MLKVGQFLGDRYEILAQIGVGGMAEVYRAKCHKLNRMVAIKVLKDEFNDKNFVSKFKAEAQAAAGLSHPNIVSIYDVGDEEDIHYIVMELVEGITLKQYIAKKKRLDIKEAIGITIQVAQGIGAAHEQHIIHRDIKPQNVIISRDGKVKVTDFGIAKVASNHTIDSKAVGSVYYFSPEQARGGYCDASSDIYSLGITLYEMLTGQVPFVGESTVAVALAHLQMDMTPPRELNPMIPVSLEKIIMKATQKKSERRYSSANELIADLRKALLMPDEDFVKIMPTESTSPTLLIGEDEITAIKQNKTVTVIDDDPEPNVVVTYSSGSDKVQTSSKPIDAEDDKSNDDDDEDDDEKVRSVWDKVVFGFGIVICILILCIAGYLLSVALKNIKPSENNETTQTTSQSETTISSKEVKMPNVEGMEFEAAVKLLKNDYNLGVTRTEKSSEDVPEGVIIQQQYPEGTILDKNSSVELIVSSGSSMIVLPDEKDIKGATLKNVRRDLRALGLVVVEETEYSSDVDADLVTRISPEAGSKVQPGSEVTIYISLGEEIQYVYVPELRGYTLDEAEELLGTDLIIGETTEEYSDGTNYSEGQIMGQSLKVNEKVEKGTKIELTISKGDQYIKLPDIEELDEEEAKEAMEKKGFVYDKTKEEYDEDIPEGKVVKAVFADADQKNGKYKISAKYTLIISNGSKNVDVPNVVGKTESEAVKLIEAAELEVNKFFEYSDTVASGNVISQSVSADSSVERGSTIDITISQGIKKASINLKNVLLHTADEAFNALSAQGFKVDKVEVESTVVSGGYVISCNYPNSVALSDGAEVPYGATVTLVVAKIIETQPVIPETPAETIDSEVPAE